MVSIRILAVLVFAVVSVSAADSVKDGISMKLVVHLVPPEYPYGLRRSGITGDGILFGQVDYKTGVVTSVRMEKGTGNRILDQAVLTAFREWRFEPGTVRQFRAPINYEMGKSGPQVRVKMQRDQATSAGNVHVAQADREEIRALIRVVTPAPILTFAPYYERTDKAWIRTGSEANSVGGLYLVQKVGRKWQVVGEKHFWLH